MENIRFINDNDLVLSKVSISEIKKGTILVMQNKEILNKYLDNITWIDFSGKKKPKKDFKGFPTNEAYTYFKFIKDLYITYTNYLPDESFIKITKEFNYVEKKGIVCIFTSVLLYFLLKSEGKEKNFKLVTGFHHHLLKEDIFLSQILANDQQGFHSFLTYNSLVIDCTGRHQNYTTFNFTKDIFISAEDGFELYGFILPKEALYEFADMFRKINNYDSIESWVNYYKTNYKKINKYLYTKENGKKC